MNRSTKWHRDEQERIASKERPENNGGITVEIEGVEWGRQKRLVRRKTQSRGGLATKIAETVTNSDVNIKELVDSGVCCSFAEARRMIAIAPEWKIKSMIIKKREEKL